MRAHRTLALVLVVGLVAGSGGGARASSHGPTSHASTTITVWFKRDARLWHTKRVASAAFPVRTAVRALLGGPNAAESAAGVKTAVPAATHLVSTSVAHGVATVNLTPQFASPATRQQIRMRLAQLTFTVTQFANARAVHLEFNGSTVTSIGRVIAKKFFTATCGTGCRGRFAVSLSYHVANAQNGTIVVSDTSATSGPPPHIVKIPVRLSP